MHNLKQMYHLNNRLIYVHIYLASKCTSMLICTFFDCKTLNNVHCNVAIGREVMYATQPPKAMAMEALVQQHDIATPIDR